MTEQEKAAATVLQNIWRSKKSKREEEIITQCFTDAPYASDFLQSKKFALYRARSTSSRAMDSFRALSKVLRGRLGLVFLLTFFMTIAASAASAAPHFVGIVIRILLDQNALGQIRLNQFTMWMGMYFTVVAIVISTTYAIFVCIYNWEKHRIESKLLTASVQMHQLISRKEIALLRSNSCAALANVLCINLPFCSLALIFIMNNVVYLMMLQTSIGLLCLGGLFTIGFFGLVHLHVQAKRAELEEHGCMIEESAWHNATAGQLDELKQRVAQLQTNELRLHLWKPLGTLAVLLVLVGVVIGTVVLSQGVELRMTLTTVAVVYAYAVVLLVNLSSVCKRASPAAALDHMLSRYNADAVVPNVTIAYDHNDNVYVVKRDARFGVTSRMRWGILGIVLVVATLLCMLTVLALSEGLTCRPATVYCSTGVEELQNTVVYREPQRFSIGHACAMRRTQSELVLECAARQGYPPEGVSVAFFSALANEANEDDLNRDLSSARFVSARGIVSPPSPRPDGFAKSQPAAKPAKTIPLMAKTKHSRHYETDIVSDIDPLTKPTSTQEVVSVGTYSKTPQRANKGCTKSKKVDVGGSTNICQKCDSDPNVEIRGGHSSKREWYVVSLACVTTETEENDIVKWLSAEAKEAMEDMPTVNEKGQTLSLDTRDFMPERLYPHGTELHEMRQQGVLDEKKATHQECVNGYGNRSLRVHASSPLLQTLSRLCAVKSISREKVIRLSPIELIAKDIEDTAGLPSAEGVGPANWGLDRIDQSEPFPLDRKAFPNEPAPEFDHRGGEGTYIFVVDTGILSTHSEFKGRILPGKDFTDEIRRTEQEPTQDCHMHGTHVASLAAGTQYGVATRATIVPVRVCDCLGHCMNSGIIKALNWIKRTTLRPAVVSMSLGGDADDQFDAAVNELIRSGVSVVVAAGNERQDACTVSPARTPDAVTVGSSNSDDKESYFSNYGPCVDLYAPGGYVRGAYINSDTASAVISGTSMATPLVSGTMALYLSGNPTASPVQARDAIVNRAAAVVRPVGDGMPTLAAQQGLLYVGKAAPSHTPFPDNSCPLGTTKFTGNLDVGETDYINPRIIVTADQSRIMGFLRGPPDTDLDLHLLVFAPNPNAPGQGTWLRVANSFDDGSDEYIDYKGTAGRTYQWAVSHYGFLGSASYLLCATTI